MKINVHTLENRKAYIFASHYKSRMRGNNKSQETINELAEFSSLPKTSSEILAAIAEEDKLLISEIAKKTKKSERAVRTHITALLRNGFLNRKIGITKTKKLAYRYSIKPLKEIAAKVKCELVRKIERLNRLAKG
ncbi:MAG: winged helix-turn-helix transcriptional regulator [Thermoplasmatales archaeon]|nr:winged helix-turn-helix transcriptional regulator [Thermoplasmatales archaeon]